MDTPRTQGGKDRLLDIVISLIQRYDPTGLAAALPYMVIHRRINILHVNIQAVQYTHGGARSQRWGRGQDSSRLLSL